MMYLRQAYFNLAEKVDFSGIERRVKTRRRNENLHLIVVCVLGLAVAYLGWKVNGLAIELAEVKVVAKQTRLEQVSRTPQIKSIEKLEKRYFVSNYGL